MERLGRYIFFWHRVTNVIYWEIVNLFRMKETHMNEMSVPSTLS